MKLVQPSMRRTIIACLLVPALTGCGGGGGQDDKTQATSQAQSGDSSQQATHQGATQQPGPSPEEATAGGNTTPSQDAHDTTQAQAKTQTRGGGEAPSAKNRADTTPDPHHPQIQSKGAQQAAQNQADITPNPQQHQSPSKASEQARCPYAGVYLTGVPEAIAGAPQDGLLIAGVDRNGMLDGVLITEGTNAAWRQFKGQVTDSTLTVVTALDAIHNTALEFTLHFRHEAHKEIILDVQAGKGGHGQPASQAKAFKGLIAAPANVGYVLKDGSWFDWDRQHTKLSKESRIRIEDTEQPEKKRVQWRANGVQITGVLTATNLTGLYTAELTLRDERTSQSVDLSGSAFTMNRAPKAGAALLLFATGTKAHLFIDAKSKER